MFFRPKPLSTQNLHEEVLRDDRKNCVHFGPCGVGNKALYLGGVLLDRSLFIPFKTVSRVYKQVAMSKGGFTGKGFFGSIPYLVVEYDGGKLFRCKFKWEEDIDSLLDKVHELYPDIPLHSLAAQKKLEEEQQIIRSRLKEHLSEEAQKSVALLKKAEAFLETHRETCRELAAASKAKRSYTLAAPFYKWAALAVATLALVAGSFGFWLYKTQGLDSGTQILILGMIGILIFSSFNMLPTRRRNEKAIAARLSEARHAMEACLYDFKNFPLPAKYAHPLALRRMKREIQEGRAETIPEAFELMKADLKSVNNSVTVFQFEYDEIVVIKPMFLIENYQ